MWLSIFKSNKSSSSQSHYITEGGGTAPQYKNFNTSKGPASSFIREVQGRGPNTVLKAQGFLVQVPGIHFIVGSKRS